MHALHSLLGKSPFLVILHRGDGYLTQDLDVDTTNENMEVTHFLKTLPKIKVDLASIKVMFNRTYDSQYSTQIVLFRRSHSSTRQQNSSSLISMAKPAS